VCWRHAVAFTVAALPAVIAATTLGQAVDGTTLIAAFAVIMLAAAAAAATWRKANSQVGRSTYDASSPSCPPLRLARVFTAGLLVGAMTGFFGVGGGFLIVPTLAFALAFSMRMAVGTSLVIITSLMALGAHLAAGPRVDVGVILAMTVSATAGALAGVRLAGHLPQRQLGQGFAALVALVAVCPLISAVLLGGPPDWSWRFSTSCARTQAHVRNFVRCLAGARRRTVSFPLARPRGASASIRRHSLGPLPPAGLGVQGESAAIGASIAPSWCSSPGAALRRTRPQCSSRCARVLAVRLRTRFGPRAPRSECTAPWRLSHEDSPQ
jgi:uncharacterized membrane protein YfcA